MTEHTFVGFVAKFPEDRPDDAPSGQELASFFSQSLIEAGFLVSEPEEHRDYAWYLCIKKDGVEINTIVGFVGSMDSTPPRQWLVTNELAFSLIPTFFRSKIFRQKRDHFLQSLCQSLHQIMTKDERFSNIVWYNKNTFDMIGDKPSNTP